MAALAPWALLAVLAAGCAGVRPHTDWDRDVDFRRYDSFAVLAPAAADEEELAEPEAGPYDSPLLLQRARQAAAEVMEDAGYLRGDKAEADIWVVARVATREKVEVWGSYYPHITWSYGWGMRGGPVARTYTEGTLILDVIDASTRELVWRGWASEPFSGAGPGPERVRRFVEAILERFPPTPAEDAGTG